LDNDVSLLLDDISRKLDSIITLLMLSNKTEFQRIKENLSSDKVFQAIISKADGTISYSELTRRVAEELQIAEITVKKKISDLKTLGVITSFRKGRETFYQMSTLFE